jgi:hypothetical protein
MKFGNILCRLCQSSDDLQDSHILPRFLGKYLKDTSATGYLMGIDTEGKPSRSQDLYKMKLLCTSCESVLNQAETFFAKTIFHPFQRGNLTNIPLDNRLGKFAVSVSLRALWIMKVVRHPLADKWKTKLDELESEWRNYLLDTPNFTKGPNSHHILLCDESLLAVGLRNSPNLIHSIMRTSAYYIFEKFGKAYLFANLAGVQVISMISPPELPVSQGTQVYPVQTFGVVTPAGIGWGGYYQNLLELAQKFEAARSRLSEAQKEQTERAMNAHPGRVAKSEDARILVKQYQIRRGIRRQRSHSDSTGRKRVRH